jgi:soluble lytic murein transglycosylase
MADQRAAMPSADRSAVKLERLGQLRQKHPGSIWAKRAGLLTGIELMERTPGDAIPFLRAAERDFPIVEDYIRYWMGVAYLKAGDPGLAAILFDSVPDIVPDTLLSSRSAFGEGAALYQLGQCRSAIEWLKKAVGGDPTHPDVSSAWLNIADCYVQENQADEAAAALRHLWVRYPHSKESQEAQARLTRGDAGWQPTPDERYGRALSWVALAQHQEAVEELNAFLSAAKGHPKRAEAKLKLGISLSRLKRYDQAAKLFEELLPNEGPEAGEASAWLARAYLRQGDGDRLLTLAKTVAKRGLTSDQHLAVLMAVGVWHEDQGQFPDALAVYRQAVRLGEQVPDIWDAWWRIGWAHYRMGRFREAAHTFHEVSRKKDDPQITPKFLYWTARALEQLKDKKAGEALASVCRKYRLTYYCQLARMRQPELEADQPADPPEDAAVSEEVRRELEQEPHYRKAVELQALAVQVEAGREFAWLADHYSKNRDVLTGLSALLSEAGSHHQALRLARLHFRDGLERGSEPVPAGLWGVAYPTVYLPTIRSYAGDRLDPFLVAAIIREESQYDTKAVSRVGALGLMQLMPATAQTVARKYGAVPPTRDDLFDHETNIRIGTRYVGQLLEQYGGNLIHAVAAYNAGPAALSNWLAKHGNRESDEFVELIPYQETRQYVKRVLRTYREYHRLDSGRCAARFLDKVC